MTSYRFAYPILLTFLLFVVCEGCSPEDIVRGCMIQAGQCFCGMGCSSEFRYKDREECKVALRGDTKDPCKSNPCYNSGACLQTTTTFSRYKCRCEGTGYYGPRCQHSCTSVNTRARAIPYECIEI